MSKGENFNVQCVRGHGERWGGGSTPQEALSLGSSLLLPTQISKPEGLALVRKARRRGWVPS